MSGEALRRRISSACVARSMLKTRGRRGSVSTGPLDLIGDARRVERLRRALMHLRPRRDEIQDDAFRFRAVPGAQDGDPVRFQRGGGSRHAGVLRRGRESTPECAVEVGLDFDHEMVLLTGGMYLQLQVL